MPSAKLIVSRESWGVLIRNLVVLLAVIGVVAYSSFPIALPLGLLSEPETRFGVFLVGSICGELASLLVLVWLLSRRGMSLAELGWGRPTSWQAILLGIIVALGYSGVTALNPYVGANLLHVSGLKAVAIVAAVVAGVVEEVIFRGYVMTSLAWMGRGQVVQVLASALAFSMAHLYGLSSPATFFATQGFTFVLGAALGIVYLVGKRSLTPVIVSHALIDAIIEPWLLLSFVRF